MNKAVIIISVLIVLAAGVLYIRGQQAGGNTSGTSPTPTNAALVADATGTPSGITGRDVDYYADVSGYYAAPVAPGDYPGVVMVHEWWGLNDTVKEMARNLAKEGYHVLAVDLFNGRVAADASEARQLTSAMDKESALKNMQAALLFLKDQKAAKVAVWGWCFGGGQAMQLSVSDAPLDATVIYYGSLETDNTKLGKIKWPVLGVFGEKDASIPVSAVRDFETKLDALSVEKEIYVYPGVGHAFANPSGESFAPKETMDAWEKTVRFLDKHLKN